MTDTGDRSSGREQGRGRMAGKVALVTGAARGLGRGIAQLLVEEGAAVFVGDLDGTAVATAAAGIGAERGFAHDVTDEAQWRDAIAAVIAAAGRLDVLVNNAGLALASGPNDIEQVTPEAWSRVVAVNGLGTMLGCKHALAAMKARGGAIVNISSIAGMTPTPTIAAYGFSKAGVTHLTRSTAKLGAPHKVRCNSVHPGIIATGMVEGLTAYHADRAGIDRAQMSGAMVGATPMGALQTERDIALGVLYLASDEARFVTGAQLVIDGGLTL